MNQPSENNNLELLKGSEMSSVVFIRDYVQLVFEGSSETGILSVYEFPTVVLQGVAYDLKVSGYRDALCSLINLELQGVQIKNQNMIRLEFNDASIIEISLRREDFEEPESAMLKIGQTIEVW